MVMLSFLSTVTATHLRKLFFEQPRLFGALFLWPSKGKYAGYEIRPGQRFMPKIHFVNAVRFVASRAGIKKFRIVAHSWGRFSTRCKTYFELPAVRSRPPQRCLNPMS